MTSVPGSLRPTVVTPRLLGDLADAVGLELSAQDRAVEVTGVAGGTRDVVPGDLFVALPGARSHGARFAAQAVAAGAVAILTDPAGRALLDEATEPVSVPVLLPAGGLPVTEVLSPVAADVYGHPATGLLTLGVTGTNGKTTTTYLLDHVLQALGRTVGLVGTVETRSGSRVLPSRLTTPDAAALTGVLATMREDAVDVLAMEVSSHALTQGRVDGIVFDVVGFTNLSQDHLDFHGDLEGYFAAKAGLFTPRRARRGVVLVDDAWGARMADESQVPVTTLSVTGAADGRAVDWAVSDVVADAHGSTFTLTHADGQTLQTTIALPGGFNVANAALALVMLVEAGVEVAALTPVLERIGGLDPRVPGRMERVARTPRVIVDFAHNPDALALAIGALRATAEGRVVVVFGATGERDTTKRPVMGAVAVEHADVVVVTDDDPHGEDAAQIREQVLVGARAAAAAAASGAVPRTVDVLEVAPRAAAIRAAVLAAADADTVLVAGRGHEVWQEVDGVDLPLDDRVEAREAVAERAGVTTKEHSE